MKKLLLIGAVVAAVFSACAKKTEVLSAAGTEQGERVLRLAFILSGNGLPLSPLTIVLEKGFLEERLKSLNVKLEAQGFVGGPALNEVIAAGGLDIATYGDVPIIAAKSNGLNTTLLGIDTYNTGAFLLVRSTSPYNSLADLKGQKIAVSTGTYGHRSIIKMLEAEGLDESYIQLTNMASRDAAPALVRGDVEAGIGSSSTYLKFVQDGSLRILKSGEEHREWNGSTGYIVIGDYGKKNPDIVDAFLQAILDSLNFIKENPEESTSILSHAGLTVEELKYTYPNGYAWNISLDERSIAAFEDILDFMVDKELVLNRFSIQDWSDPGYLQTAGAKR
ncbi:MAG: ABC transporter substrate-binding protein [Treponema sp.]|jgi:ABC-type nitrate/sulfonate/bicarbonate transport system substrate-binding protein|nr:ABC transporter substrate-binding protein [Treponema sp.]